MHLDTLHKGNSSQMAAASVLALRFMACCHVKNTRNKFVTVPHSNLLEELFQAHHDFGNKGRVTVKCGTKIDCRDSELFEVEGGMNVGTLVENFGIRMIQFCCETVTEAATDLLQTCVEEANTKAADAFQLLMAGGRRFPSKKLTSQGMKAGQLSKKDEIFNCLVDDFTSKGLDFPKGTENTQGVYVLQVLCNALWCVTNHHETIKDASRNSEVTAIPPPFNSEKFKNQNDTKKKKIKNSKLSANELKAHSQALYSLLLKPVMKSSPAWCTAYNEVKDLAESFSSYSEYLNKKLEHIKGNQNLDHPVRTVGENATVEHRPKAKIGVQKKYSILDAKVLTLNDGEFIFFDEKNHLDEQFKNNMQRLRFLSDLHLSAPVDIYRFCPGGGILTTVCFVKVQEGRSLPQILTQAARFVMHHKDMFKEYHTREQKRAFKNSLNNVAGVLPSVSEFIYKELALDASKCTHPDMQERLRLIFLGEKGLIADLRKLNCGRPTGSFDVFFEQLQNIVEEVTAVDDRRHGTEHLSKWLSLDDLIEQAKARCPENSAIPSKSLVRLQFAPRNPFAKTSWNFTSRINVQYKIQRRQLRLSHPDEHYCNALLKYLKEFAVDMNKKCNVAMFCCDDKAKVPLGEPGFAVSTGVRGKQSIVPTTSTLVAGDHDMTKSSLTPSVILKCDLPDTADQSFVRGQVYVTVNDSVFQASNPFRHAATLVKVTEALPDINVLLLYTDGGTDHRNTLVSVQCSAICLFKQLNVDLLILARCAPGHSWRNPAERIMSLLNIGLQNCSLEREKCDDDVERCLKKYGSMKDIRDKSSPEVKQAYKESVEPVQATIRNRFSRLKLKEKSVEVLDPVTDTDIDICKRHLRELFPALNLDKLQKNVTKKVVSLVDWMAKHCRERQYVFQIRKCKDENCCIPSQQPLPADIDLSWLPDPILLDDKEHFRSYEESKGKETDESDRPSLKIPDRVQKPKINRKRSHTTDEDENLVEENTENMDTDENVREPELDPFPFSAQTARGVVNCTECNKPRVYYSKTRLSSRQNMLLATSISEYDYTCGSHIAEDVLLRSVAVKMNINCASPVEVAYYSSDFGRSDICSHCGDSDGTIDLELKKQYKTVLPLCETCKNAGQHAFTQRPYGRKK